MVLGRKTPRESSIKMSELVLPEHTNVINQLMGGKLMHWMDIGSFLVAQRHANRAVVTVSVDNISFKHPIQLGNMVNIHAQITRTFKTSMEIYVRVRSENMMTGEKFDSNTAFFSFVALDQNGQPTEIPEIVPENEEEQELFKGAARRRRLRLLLSPARTNDLDDILNKMEGIQAPE